jgi:hypothetical protein
MNVPNRRNDMRRASLDVVLIRRQRCGLPTASGARRRYRSAQSEFYCCTLDVGDTAQQKQAAKRPRAVMVLAIRNLEQCVLLGTFRFGSGHP